MKRPFILGLFILFTDQILKWYFQTWFDGKRWLISDSWGFTYITNPGIWLKSDISPSTMLIIQIYALMVWVYLIFMLSYYHKNFRKSLMIDLAFGFFTAAIFGNVIVDRLIFGYVRDFFINPIAVSNLADFSGEIALGLVITEIVVYSRSRSLVRLPED